MPEPELTTDAVVERPLSPSDDEPRWVWDEVCQAWVLCDATDDDPHNQ